MPLPLGRAVCENAARIDRFSQRRPECDVTSSAVVPRFRLRSCPDLWRVDTADPDRARNAGALRLDSVAAANAGHGARFRAQQRYSREHKAAIKAERRERAEYPD